MLLFGSCAGCYSHPVPFSATAGIVAGWHGATLEQRQHETINKLNIIRAHDPCASGWQKLLTSLGKSKADDEPLDFARILASNGLNDALWALRAVIPEHEKDRDRLARLFAADCAESVLHLYESKYPDDKRPRNAIVAARQFANGEITAAARAAASDAARAAARDAAWAAAWAAAWDAFKIKYVEYFCQ